MKFTSRCALLAALSAAILARSTPASAELIYGVGTQANTQFLITWNSNAPGTLLSSNPLTRLNSGDTVLGIDFRPATGQLYALVAAGNATYLIETINLADANSTFPVGTSGVGVNGFSHGFDFNPMIDRIRVVTDTNKNYVFNPITGALQLAATDLAYGAADPNFGKDPNVGGSAYSNNTLVPPASTQLYGIDTGLDILVTQANNAGTLGTVGPLGVDVSALAGFDISKSGVAYATMTPAGASQSTFYTINLVTGAATPVGVVGGGVVITAMAVLATIPEPTTMVGATLALAALVGVRRRQG